MSYLYVYDCFGLMRHAFRKFHLKDAEANLPELVERAARGKPSVITRDGEPHAVVLSYAEWQRLSGLPPAGQQMAAPPLQPGLPVPARHTQHRFEI
jgi:prevent-host-death family protein